MSERASPISALVVLRPASGPLTADDRITSANVAGYLPDPAVVERVVGWFRGAGFSVEAAVGLSVSIVGPAALFRRVFEASVRLPIPLESTGRDMPAEGLQLPLDALPPDLREAIEVVEFTPPPAFGPTEYMP